MKDFSKLRLEQEAENPHACPPEEAINTGLSFSSGIINNVRLLRCSLAAWSCSPARGDGLVDVSPLGINQGDLHLQTPAERSRLTGCDGPTLLRLQPFIPPALQCARAALGEAEAEELGGEVQTRPL